MDEFMRAAVEEVKKGEREDGQAFGSVLVRNGEIISRGHNRILQRGNVTSHAEIETIGNAGLQQAFPDTVIYTTALPCEMCEGAIAHLEIPKVGIGFSGLKGNTIEYMRSFGTEVVEQHLDECTQLMIESWAKYPERCPESARARKD